MGHDDDRTGFGKQSPKVGSLGLVAGQVIHLARVAGGEPRGERITAQRGTRLYCAGGVEAERQRMSQHLSGKAPATIVAHSPRSEVRDALGRVDVAVSARRFTAERSESIEKLSDLCVLSGEFSAGICITPRTLPSL